MFEGSYKNLLHHRLFITKALILESPPPLGLRTKWSFKAVFIKLFACDGGIAPFDGHWHVRKVLEWSPLAKEEVDDDSTDALPRLV